MRVRPGQVWRIPTPRDSDRVPLLRVLVRLQSLGVTAPHPLNFAASSTLCQLAITSLPAWQIFGEGTVLNSFFLLRADTLARHGYELLGTQPFGPDEIEFPCFLDWHTSHGLRYCRGEFHQSLSADPPATLGRWDVRCAIHVPSSLPAIAHDVVNTGIQSSRFSASDIRLHPDRAAIESTLSVSLEGLYYSWVLRALPVAQRAPYIQAAQASGWAGPA